MKKNILIICISIIGLTACSKHNELQHQDTTATVKILRQSAIVTEQSKNISPALGATYIDCMDQVDLSSNCQLFFDGMLVNVKKVSGYHNTTRSDLVDKKSYSKIRDQYVSLVMSSVKR